MCVLFGRGRTYDDIRESARRRNSDGRGGRKQEEEDEDWRQRRTKSEHYKQATLVAVYSLGPELCIAAFTMLLSHTHMHAL